MRKKYWSFDTVTVELEDRDATVTVFHILTCTEVSVRFRLKPAQVQGSIEDLRRKIETLATNHILDLASYLDNP
jgi:hypothetical protein